MKTARRKTLRWGDDGTKEMLATRDAQRSQQLTYAHRKSVRHILVLFRFVPVQNCKQKNPSLFRHRSYLNFRARQQLGYRMCMWVRMCVTPLHVFPKIWI